MPKVCFADRTYYCCAARRRYSSVVERRVCDRKVDDHWFGSRTGNAGCTLVKETLCLFPTGTKQSTRCGGPA